MLKYEYTFDPSMNLNDPFETFNEISENTSNRFRRKCQSAYTTYGTSVEGVRISSFSSEEVIRECVEKFRFGDTSKARGKYTGYFFADPGYIQRHGVFYNKEHVIDEMRLMHERFIFMRNNKTGKITIISE